VLHSSGRGAAATPERTSATSPWLVAGRSELLR
jgi:hypothetical protein